MDKNDTIAAIATPIGQGGIGLIRMSGKDSIHIISRIFSPKNNIDLINADSHTIHYGTIIDNNNEKIPIDEVLVSIMKAPRTYTKEDIVEISCHGSYVVLQKILNILITIGARLAEPGEFTKRAFLNGRMDLTQAEAVIDIINAKTEDASKSAIKHLEGYLSIYIKKLQDSIKEILISLEAHIDFSDDIGSEFNYKDIKEKLSDMITSLESLMNTYNQGKILKDGIVVSIIGKTNVGKSSLFNALIDSPSRAMVAHIPGTTRDYLDENINISGRLFRFIDTAGFKSPRGVVEEKSLGITKKCIDDADIVLFVLDGSKLFSRKDLDIWNVISNKPCIVVVNKADLKIKISKNTVEDVFKNKKVINVSCKDNKGIPELKETIVKLSNSIDSTPLNADIIITNVRHKDIMDKTISSIKDSISAINKNLSLEFIASDLKHALESLQEMTGERISENILDDIFSKFCIGK
jgi:tRNA modification GTPase